MSKIIAAVFLAFSMSAGAFAQGAVAPPPPVESAPLAPPAEPAPPAVDNRSVEPSRPPSSLQAVPAAPVDPNATLAGKPGDPTDVDDVILPERPVAIISGQTTWDQGFQQLQAVFARLRAETAREGLKIAGRPLTLFIETDDIGYRFEAMLPVDHIPEARAGAGEGLRFGVTPSGRAMRFSHKAAYEDIDSTYETITAYLEAKGVTVKDAFLEEYVTEMTDVADPNLEINVYVQPK